MAVERGILYYKDTRTRDSVSILPNANEIKKQMNEHFRMSQMARIIKLAFLIRYNPETYTRPALAKLFKVNKGTIQRDINLLKEMGIDIKAQGKQGYVILSGFDFMEKKEDEKNTSAKCSCNAK